MVLERDEFGDGGVEGVSFAFKCGGKIGNGVAANRSLRDEILGGGEEGLEGLVEFCEESGFGGCLGVCFCVGDLGGELAGVILKGAAIFFGTGNLEEEELESECGHGFLELHARV